MRKLILGLLLVSVAQAQQYDQTQIPYSTVLGTSGATIPLLNGANTWSASQTFSAQVVPSSTNGVKGTTAADVAIAGSIGEVFSVNCPAPVTATITISTPGSPGTVSWPSHPFAAVSAANYTCPINFTNSGGALPTGLVAGITYYIVGASVSGDTFQISDTPAHALAATNKVNITDAGTGTQSGFMGALMTTTTSYAGAGLSLTAGDWDCSGLAEFGNLTALTVTKFVAAIDSVVALNAPYSWVTIGSQAIGANSYYLPTMADVRENVSATTTVFVVDWSVFSAGSQNAAGFLRCRRMR